MNKICGYNCEHNKGGICQITYCDKIGNMTTTTKESNPELYNALFEDENLEIITKILNKEIDRLEEENKRLNNIINELEEDLDYEINDYKGNIDMEEKTLSGEFCRGMAFEADYLKNRIENLKEGK